MKINIAKPLIGDEEIAEVTRVLRSGMIASGPETKKFEEEFADFVGSKYACAATNGTAAISVALSACGIGPGDEVITSPFTFVATANAILSCGATPVFADINEETFNLCPKSTIEALTEKTKAIMPVHLYGLAAEMDSFREIAEKHNLFLIGDAAQAHGAMLNGMHVGSLADFECFSFYPTKNMTTGEGGMITTSNLELYNNANSIRNHGRPTNTLGTYEYQQFGLNVRLTDIGSAIGRVQLRRLTEFNSNRARNAKLLTENLTGVKGIVLPTVPEGYVHAWHQYTIKVEKRDELISFLKENNIGCGIYYPRTIYEYPHLEKYRSDCKVADLVASQALSLPVHAGLTIDEVEEVARVVAEWANEQ